MTGQDAVNVAKSFKEKVGVTGIVLTRIDGDARGGAALSMRAITGVPIKLLGTGEKLDALEDFHPDRLAGRILGMGDIVSLVEKAIETTEADEAERLAKKMQKGQFDLDDMASQLKQLQKMGGLAGVMGMLPGIGKMQKQLEGKVDEKHVKRSLAIISSMTPKERRNPDLIKASRKNRIAKGSGVGVQEINKLLKQHHGNGPHDEAGLQARPEGPDAPRPRRPDEGRHGRRRHGRRRRLRRDAMIDHLSVGVADLAKAKAFYDAVLQPLGCTLRLHRRHSGPGRRRPWLWRGRQRPSALLDRPAGEAGRAAPMPAGGAHICLRGEEPHRRSMLSTPRP